MLQMLICNNNCNGQQLYANKSERPIYSTLVNSQQLKVSSISPLRPPQLILRTPISPSCDSCQPIPHVQRPFDIFISNSMKVLIMHLCICTAWGRFRYIGDIYTIYGAFICVSRLGFVGFLKPGPKSWEAGGSSCFFFFFDMCIWKIWCG